MNVDVLGELIVGGSLKGASVALVGMLIAWRWKRRAAVDRHALWVLVIVSFLILPLMRKVGRRWGVLPSSVANMEAPILESKAERDVLAAGLSLSPVASRTISVPEMASESPGIPRWAIIWLAGIVLTLSRVAVGRCVLWSLGRQAENGRIQVRVGQQRDQLGIRRRIEVVLNARRGMPMTWGWQRPKILLPEEAGDWDKERLDAVILHELTHIQRHDALT